MIKTPGEVLADLQEKLLGNGLRVASSETVVSYPCGSFEALYREMLKYGKLVNQANNRKVSFADTLLFAEEHFQFTIRRDTVSIRLSDPQEGRGTYSIETKTSEYSIWIMPTELIAGLDDSFTIKGQRYWADNVSSTTTYYEFTVKSDGSISLDKEEEVHR